jgi:hypothetical protein
MSYERMKKKEAELEKETVDRLQPSELRLDRSIKT